MNGNDERGVIEDFQTEEARELLRREEEEVLEGKWRIPERYKLIGATSFAFVICNMDKVTTTVIVLFFSGENYSKSCQSTGETSSFQ